jgi:hypothetical protein
MRKTPKFKSEHELCEAFIAEARKLKFKVYPENESWDILLVRQDGTQFGVQAKLHPNIDVIGQALPCGVTATSPTSWDFTGPDYRCVLIPKTTVNFSRVANLCCILVLTPEYGFGMSTLLMDTPSLLWEYRDRVWTPDFEPNVPAGVPSPVTVSRWKIGAVKLSQDLVDKGYITTVDAAKYRINLTGWIHRWVSPTADKEGKKKKYVAIPGVKLPHELFPEAIAPVTKPEEAKPQGDQK